MASVQGEMKLKAVGKISDDIIPGDILWFTPNGEQRLMTGRVLDTDCPDGQWDASASGAVFRVRHGHIVGLITVKSD